MKDQEKERAKCDNKKTKANARLKCLKMDRTEHRHKSKESSVIE